VLTSTPCVFAIFVAEIPAVKSWRMLAIFARVSRLHPCRIGTSSPTKTCVSLIDPRYHTRGPRNHQPLPMAPQSGRAQRLIVVWSFPGLPKHHAELAEPMTQSTDERRDGECLFSSQTHEQLIALRPSHCDDCSLEKTFCNSRNADYDARPSAYLHTVRRIFTGCEESSHLVHRRHFAVLRTDTRPASPSDPLEYVRNGTLDDIRERIRFGEPQKKSLQFSGRFFRGLGN
jgi:hypothetical protein